MDQLFVLSFGKRWMVVTKLLLVRLACVYALFGFAVKLRTDLM